MSTTTVTASKGLPQAPAAETNDSKNTYLNLTYFTLQAYSHTQASGLVAKAGLIALGIIGDIAALAFRLIAKAAILVGQGAASLKDKVCSLISSNKEAPTKSQSAPTTPHNSPVATPRRTAPTTSQSAPATPRKQPTTPRAPNSSPDNSPVGTPRGQSENLARNAQQEARNAQQEARNAQQEAAALRQPKDKGIKELAEDAVAAANYTTNDKETLNRHASQHSREITKYNKNKEAELRLELKKALPSADAASSTDEDPALKRPSSYSSVSAKSVAITLIGLATLGVFSFVARQSNFPTF